MPPKIRKCTTGVTVVRRLTRLQARLNAATPTPDINPSSFGRSLASPSCSRKNAKIFPKAAKSSTGKVNGKRQKLVILPDESDNESNNEISWHHPSINDLYRSDNLSEKLEVRTNDPSHQLHSDADEHSPSISQSPSDYEVGMKTYARRSVNIRSTPRAAITGNTSGDCRAAASTTDCVCGVGNSSSRLTDVVRRCLDAPFLTPVREHFPAENVPRTTADIANGMMQREEPTMTFTTTIERPQGLTRTCSFGLTEMVNMCDLDSGMDEVESHAVDTVHIYRVKLQFVSVLKRIFEKYGDIAASYVMDSPESRSSALEEICQIFHMFQGKRFNGLSQIEITNSLARVRDFGKAGMKVHWFQKRLEDMEDAKLKIKESSSLKEEKNKCNELVEELETKLKDCKALSSTLKDMINEEKRKLQLYEAKFQELQEREKSTMKILEKAQAKSTKLNQIASDAISKVRSFVEHPLVDDLL